MPDPSAELLELVRAATLDSIEFTEISARRVPAQDDDQPPRLDLNTEVQDLADATEGRRAFRYALKVTIHDVEGDVTVEPRATYYVDLNHAQLLDDQITVTDFANEVAVMALIPYARQAIADATLRVFSASILMPVFERGHLKFGESGTDPSLLA